MIILATIGMICFAAYAFFVIDLMVDRFDSERIGLLVCLFCILIPPAIIVEILTYMEIIK